MSSYAFLFDDRLRYEKPRLTRIGGEWFCRILVDGTDVAGGHTPRQAFKNWQTMLPRYYEFNER